MWQCPDQSLRTGRADALATCASLLVALAAACAPSNAGDPDAGSGPALDGGGDLVPDAGISAEPTAVLLTIGGEDPHVRVLSVLGDGTIVDNDLRVPIGPAPRQLAFRDDGREASAVYAASGPGSPKGLVTFALEPDGSSADVDGAHSSALGDNFSPNDIFYAGNDELVMTRKGPIQGDLNDNLLMLHRSGDGFGDEESGAAVNSGEGPLELHPLADGRALMLRTDIFGPVYEAVPIARQPDGGWAVDGTGVPFDQMVIELVVNHQRDRAYVPLDGADNPADMHNRLGLLRTLVADGSDSWTDTDADIELSGAGSQIALSRASKVAVINDPLARFDQELLTVVVDQYRLMTVFIDDSGVPAEAPGEATVVDALMIDDFDFTASGLLLVAMSLSTEQSAGPTNHKLVIFAGSNQGTWTALDEIYLEAPAYQVSAAPEVDR